MSRGAPISTAMLKGNAIERLERVALEGHSSLSRIPYLE